MRHRWGTVDQERPKVPEVRVSFNRGDKVAIDTIARWFGVSVKEFEKMIPPKGEAKDG